MTDISNAEVKNSLDFVSEGIIILNNEGIIRKYNRRAKEILGFAKTVEKHHNSGKIAEGDIVFIVDTIVGDDDGGLDSADLKKIGIDCHDIQQGQGILCCGIYGRDIGGSCRIINHEQLGKYTFGGFEGNLSYSLVLNTAEKYTMIKVNDEEYRLDYINSISNLVIFRDCKMVFYQSMGYSTRGEELKNILNGAEFHAKNPKEEFNPEGKIITEVHSDSKSLYKELLDYEAEDEVIFENRYIELNKVPILASLYALKDSNGKSGALLKFKGIKELTSISKESGEASKKLSEFTRRYQSSSSFSEILGISDNMLEVKRLAAQAAKTDSSVLILGDSGTGKTYLSRKIHENSRRKGKPFITINCASIPKELVESELFGYDRNAFTGASQSGKKGLIELGQGGTLFFDEIGDMSLDMQAKLLSFIQDRKFFRVGGNAEIKVDVRMIFATNRNLEEAVKSKLFREDLFYRINVIPIHIKPLRERREDIPALVTDIFEKLKNNMGLKDKVLSEDAMNLLLVYDYPGNIREMENLIQRAISLSELNVVNASNFMIREYVSLVKGGTLRDILTETERRVILDTLAKNKGNVKKTYTELGVGKTNFYKKVKLLEIDLDRFK